MSFKVNVGEKLAIVGASGSGKSTALKLMTRLHDTTYGSVRVTDYDVRDVPLAEVYFTIVTCEEITNNLAPSLLPPPSDHSISLVPPPLYTATGRNWSRFAGYTPI